MANRTGGARGGSGVRKLGNGAGTRVPGLLEQLKAMDIEQLHAAVRHRGVLPTGRPRPNRFECIGLLAVYGFAKNKGS